jgi:hypothetical protein
MLFSEIPNNSFYNYDHLQIYCNNNSVKFLAMEGNIIKRTQVPSFEIEVKESSKEEFIKALQQADVSDGMSLLLQQGLLKELK